MNNGKRTILRCTFLIIVAVLLVGAVLAIGSEDAEGETIYVDDDGGAEYTNIQDAVDAAEEGDTIRVWEGTYEENVVVDKSVSLVGNGSEVTTINGGGYDGVKITSDRVNMSRFSVTGGGQIGSGIKVESDNNHIFKNNCSNNGFGIFLVHSNECTLDNNTFSSNINRGIRLFESSECTITNNTFSSNDRYGIDLVDSNDCILENNTMDEDSINMVGSLENLNTHVIDTTNMINGKPVHYYKNVSGFTVPYGAGQVILANCSGITVENQDCSNGLIGILVGYSSNFTLMNNTCSNNDYGIKLYSSSDCTIMYNTCSSNSRRGIYLWDSSRCKLMFNTCSNNDYGIYINGDHNTLSNNICNLNNYSGIVLFGSDDTRSNSEYTNPLFTSSNCQLTNNTCNDNIWYGIYFRYSSNNNSISNCTLSGNEAGIYIKKSSENNSAHCNNIYNNTKYGIDASDNDGYTINATKNYWGDASGPYHPTKNPEGEGDNVTDYVIFDPWLDEPVDESTNTPPTANAGNDQTVCVGEEVQFNGSGTDLDGGIIKYEWDFDGDGTYDWESTTSGETTHTYTVKGTYNAKLKVTDNESATDTDGCKITVNEKGNSPPTVELTSPANGTTISSTSTTLSWDGNDNDDDTLTYNVYLDTNVNPTTKLTDDQAGELYDATGLTEGEPYYWKVVVSDGEDETESAVWSFSVDLSSSNLEPTVSITSPTNNSQVSDTVIINGTTSDQDGTVTTVEVSIDGGIWMVATGTDSWRYEWDSTTVSNGEHHIRARSFDGIEYSEIAYLTLDVANAGGKDTTPPTITHSAVTSATEGEKIIIIATITDEGDGVQSVTLHYRKTGESDYTTKAMTGDGDSYTVEIPAGDVTITGIEYYIEATDGTNTATAPVESGSPYEITVGEDGGGEDDDNGGSIPGFGAMLLVVGMAVPVVAHMIRKMEVWK